MRLITSPRPSRSRAEAIRSVLVSCHTMAWPYGRPVCRFQASVVSRWLVRPSATRLEGRRFVAFSTVMMTALVRSQISTGLCSTQPGRGMICVCSSWCLATSAPAWSKSMNLVLVVP